MYDAGAILVGRAGDKATLNFSHLDLSGNAKSVPAFYQEVQQMLSIFVARETKRHGGDKGPTTIKVSSTADREYSYCALWLRHT